MFLLTPYVIPVCSQVGEGAALCHSDSGMQDDRCLVHILNQNHPNVFVLADVPHLELGFGQGERGGHNSCVISEPRLPRLRQIPVYHPFRVGHGVVSPAWNTSFCRKAMLSQEQNQVSYHQSPSPGNNTAFLYMWLVFSAQPARICNPVSENSSYHYMLQKK